MPWIQNSKGEKEYKLSIYTKEELPTWDEVYNEWYKNQQFIYDPDDEKCQKMDLYWKIPHSIYLLATVCNQLNKMIYEDGYKDELLEYLNSTSLFSQLGPVENVYEFKDILFIGSDCLMKQVHDKAKSKDFIKYLTEYWGLSYDVSPVIYSIKLPNGEDNPFIINKNQRRIYIDQTQEFHKRSAINIYAYCHVKNTETTGPILEYSPFDEDPKKYFEIIKFMMNPFISYFENGIGWKNIDGRLITSKRTVLDFDPAK